MNRGDIFEFNGDRFVTRVTSGSDVYASKLAMKDGVETPRVGKPRLFKDLKADVVGFLDLPEKRKAGTTHTSQVEPDDSDEDATSSDSPEELARRQASVERMSKDGKDGYEW